MNQAPKWLEDIVIEGLQMLVALRLRNAPPADTIDSVVDVWLLACMTRFTWDERRDEPRLRLAFYRAIGRLDAWPAPAQVFNEMPALAMGNALPPPKPAKKPEVASKHMSMMHKLLASWTVPKQKPINRAEQHLKVVAKIKESS